MTRELADPLRPSIVTRLAAGIGAAIAAGAILGGAAWLSDQLPWPANLLLPANLIGIWLGVAFALGATAGTVVVGAVRGSISLLSAVAFYYALFALFGEGFRAIGAGHAASIWGTVALLAGPVMGIAGATWRRARQRPRAIGVAVLAAALLGEGLSFGLPRLGASGAFADAPGTALFMLEAAVGAAIPFVLLRPAERLPGYLATALLVPTAALVIGPATSLLRALADRF